MKKIKNTNLLFLIALSLGMLIHIFFLFIVPYFHDETHYATVPFRLMNGDSLMQHEWHLTQFASLFSFLPVRIWTAIKGSTDGMFIFLRCVYLFVHTTMAVLIYRVFKQYGKWAILASMMFYIQITYRIQAISYQSMFVVFLLLFTLSLLSIYKKQSIVSYIFAGVCFGCCCVCNPLFCVAFVLYLIGCVVWTKREGIRDALVRRKISNSGKKLSKKQKKQQMSEAFSEMENYNCFFQMGAILKFACGILITAVIALVFFFSTGGTIDSVFSNLEYLFGSSEYDIASTSIFAKFIQTIKFFSAANLGLPFILPGIFVALLFDKERKNNSHRFAFLAVTLVWSGIFIFSVLKSVEFKLFAVSLPFFVFSTVCYILTENKNTNLFYCMTVPSLIAAGIHYLAADTHLAAIGVVLAVSNVPGVIFAMELFKEMRLGAGNKSEEIDDDHSGVCRKIIIASLCVQMAFYGIFYVYGQIPMQGPSRATSGPYSGLYMSEEQYIKYNKAMDDLNYIKSITGKEDPVLLATYENWMYLHLDRPMATYTTWYRGSLDRNLLVDYYKANPDKVPKYIYIDSPSFNSQMIAFTTNIVNSMFEVTRQDLSCGVLLKVEQRKF